MSEDLGSADTSPGDRAGSQWSLGSLQGRLLWSMLLVLVLALAGLGLRTAADASRRLHLEADASARAAARSVALTIENPLLTQQLDQVEEALLRLALMPGLRELRVTDGRGQLIGQVVATVDGDPQPVFGPSRPPLVTPADVRPSTSLQQQAGGERVLVAWHPVGSGTPVGWVQAVHSLEELDTLQREVVVRTGATAVAAVLLGGLALWGLLRAPMAYLRQAGRFARQLRRADGTQMVLDPRAPHEARTLVASLNSSSARLAEQARAIDTALAAVRRNSDELDQRNRELDAILSISPNGLLALDGQGLIRFANAAIQRFTGLAPADLVGRPLGDLERLLRERCGASADWPGFSAVLQAGHGGGAGAPLLSLTQPSRVDLRLELGQVDTAGIAMLVSLQDITHEREVERLKSEFLSTAAHELRTPMVSVHGFTELLLQRVLPAERQRTMLEAIHRNSTQMNHIVDELLDLARIEARGDQDFQRGPVRLGALLRDTVPDFQPPAGRSPVTIEGDDLATPVWADAAKLRQVLLNLLSNAYKYSKAPGRVTVKLMQLTAATGPARVGFAVVDQGIGMTPEQQARVFERFYRADPSGKVLGSGLGMAIVQEIVQLHGGEVTVHSQPGQGTTATVWLPAMADMGARPLPVVQA